jgi:hypothetical protein
MIQLSYTNAFGDDVTIAPPSGMRPGVQSTVTAQPGKDYTKTVSTRPPVIVVTDPTVVNLPPSPPARSGCGPWCLIVLGLLTMTVVGIGVAGAAKRHKGGGKS